MSELNYLEKIYKKVKLGELVKFNNPGVLLALVGIVITMFFVLKNSNVITIPPTPYIGSHGPNNTPLFTSLPVWTSTRHTSQIHPMNENTKKNKI